MEVLSKSLTVGDIVEINSGWGRGGSSDGGGVCQGGV